LEPISRIDPTQGRLFFRGVDATELSRTSSFEAVLFLILYGSPPSSDELRHLTDEMRLGRSQGKAILPSVLPSDNLGGRSPLDRLVGNLDDIGKRYGLDLEHELLLLVAVFPVVVAAKWRRAHGLETISPRSELGHGANTLWMLGISNIGDVLKDFETCLILHLDDPQNPSLNVLEEKMQSGEPVSSSLSAALEEHSKALHHGAGEQAMLMMQEMGSPERAEEYLRSRIERGERVFGMGHRVYRAMDPRANVLRGILQRRTAGTDREILFRLTEAVATIGSRLLFELKGQKLYPNVDLYNAAVYSTFGIPAELNTDMFAISRVCGWAAHILDWHRTGIE